MLTLISLFERLSVKPYNFGHRFSWETSKMMQICSVHNILNYPPSVFNFLESNCSAVLENIETWKVHVLHLHLWRCSVFKKLICYHFRATFHTFSCNQIEFLVPGRGWATTGPMDALATLHSFLKPLKRLTKCCWNNWNAFFKTKWKRTHITF
jgi:hypothetical protein